MLYLFNINTVVLFIVFLECSFNVWHVKGNKCKKKNTLYKVKHISIVLASTA